MRKDVVKFESQLSPHNIEAEQSTLGSLMIMPSIYKDLLEIINASDFYRPAHGEIFDAICSLAARNEPVDLITLQEELRSRGRLEEVGGTQYLMTLIEQVPSAARAANYATIVKKLSIERREIALCLEISAIIQDTDGNPTAVVEKIHKLDELAKNNISTVQLPLIKFADAVSEEIPEARWIIEGMIPKGGIVMIAGDSGVGKTWFAMQLALSACLGMKFLGKFGASASGAIYVDCESGEIILRQRSKNLWRAIYHSLIQDIEDQDDIEEKSEFLGRLMTQMNFMLSYYESNLLETEAVERIINQLKLNSAELLILDPFNRVFGGNENDSGEISKFFNNMKKIRDETGAAIVLIHHSRKKSFNAPSDAGQMLRGSSAIKAALDSHIFIRKVKDDILLVEHEKSRYSQAVEPFCVELVNDEAGVRLQIKNDSYTLEDSKVEAATHMIIDFLSSNGSAFRKNIVDALQGEVGKRNVSYALTALTTNGLVTKTRVGHQTKYQLNIEEVLIDEES